MKGEVLHDKIFRTFHIQGQILYDGGCVMSSQHFLQRDGVHGHGFFGPRGMIIEIGPDDTTAHAAPQIEMESYTFHPSLSHDGTDHTTISIIRQIAPIGGIRFDAQTVPPVPSFQRVRVGHVDGVIRRQIDKVPTTASPEQRRYDHVLIGLRHGRVHGDTVDPLRTVKYVDALPSIVGGVVVVTIVVVGGGVSRSCGNHGLLVRDRTIVIAGRRRRRQEKMIHRVMIPAETHGLLLRPQEVTDPEYTYFHDAVAMTTAAGAAAAAAATTTTAITILVLVVLQSIDFHLVLRPPCGGGISKTTRRSCCSSG